MIDAPSPRPAIWIRALLWILALAFMMGAAMYQRTTGPTYPLNGESVIGGQTIAFELIRSENTDRDARVAIPRPTPATRATVFYKRYGTDDAMRPIPMEASGDSLSAFLPRQPAAGKLSYYIEVRDTDELVHIPEGEAVVMRFKDPVPLGVLLAHVLTMFFGMLVGVRAALAAAFDPRGAKSLTLAALLLMTVGGMILGPIVQISVRLRPHRQQDPHHVDRLGWSGRRVPTARAFSLVPRHRRRCGRGDADRVHDPSQSRRQRTGL
jgi:hypothetical protein